MQSRELRIECKLYYDHFDAALLMPMTTLRFYDYLLLIASCHLVKCDTFKNANCNYKMLLMHKKPRGFSVILLIAIYNELKWWKVFTECQILVG